MKKDLTQAYNNFKVLCDNYKCNAVERNELNLNLLNFRNHIDSLPDEEVLETESADKTDEPLNP